MPTTNALAWCPTKRMGRLRSPGPQPGPIPFMEPVFSRKKDRTTGCVRIHTSHRQPRFFAARCPRATPYTSLPAGNSTSSHKFDVKEVTRNNRSYCGRLCRQAPNRMKFQNGPRFAAIHPRAAWPPGPAKLAPIFAATDNYALFSLKQGRNSAVVLSAYQSL